MGRGPGIAVVAVVCAFLGGMGALLVGKATGWTDGNGETVVLTGFDGATPASRSETAPQSSAAEPLPGNGFEPDRIYAERNAGVVTVISLFGSGEEATPDGSAQGSGFVVDEEGYVLTNSHVITTAGEGDPEATPEAANRVFVEFRDGERVPARVIGWDVFDDVGLLKVDPLAHGLDPVPLGDSSKVVVGEPVAAIGTPFGQTNTLTVGVVAATERSIDSLTSQYSLVDAIQTDAPINRGNSGGPLFDARGLAIGINAQIRSETGTAEGVGFAIPINSAIRSMEQLKDGGKVHYAWLGVSTQTLTPSLAERFDFPVDRGAAIQNVIEGSPAKDAGMRGGGDEQEFAGIRIATGGDVIVAIDGQAIESAEDVVRAITDREPGERARFTVQRGDKRLVVDVVLGERPANPPETGR